jgi:hypothetical protein
VERRASSAHVALGAGAFELAVFEGGEHGRVARAGPQTDRAREMIEGFIARQLAA